MLLNGHLCLPTVHTSYSLLVLTALVRQEQVNFLG